MKLLLLLLLLLVAHAITENSERLDEHAATTFHHETFRKYHIPIISHIPDLRFLDYLSVSIGNGMITAPQIRSKRHLTVNAHEHDDQMCLYMCSTTMLKGVIELRMSEKDSNGITGLNQNLLDDETMDKYCRMNEESQNCLNSCHFHDGLLTELKNFALKAFDVSNYICRDNREEFDRYRACYRKAIPEVRQCKVNCGEGTTLLKSFLRSSLNGQLLTSVDNKEISEQMGAHCARLECVLTCQTPKIISACNGEEKAALVLRNFSYMFVRMAEEVLTDNLPTETVEELWPKQCRNLAEERKLATKFVNDATQFSLDSDSSDNDQAEGSEVSSAKSNLQTENLNPQSFISKNESEDSNPQNQDSETRNEKSTPETSIDVKSANTRTNSETGTEVNTETNNAIVQETTKEAKPDNDLVTDTESQTNTEAVQKTEVETKNGAEINTDNTGKAEVEDITIIENDRVQKTETKGNSETEVNRQLAEQTVQDDAATNIESSGKNELIEETESSNEAETSHETEPNTSIVQKLIDEVVTNTKTEIDAERETQTEVGTDSKTEAKCKLEFKEKLVSQNLSNTETENDSQQKSELETSAQTNSNMETIFETEHTQHTQTVISQQSLPEQDPESNSESTANVANPSVEEPETTDEKHETDKIGVSSQFKASSSSENVESTLENASNQDVVSISENTADQKLVSDLNNAKNQAKVSSSINSEIELTSEHVASTSETESNEVNVPTLTNTLGKNGIKTTVKNSDKVLNQETETSSEGVQASTSENVSAGQKTETSSEEVQASTSENVSGQKTGSSANNSKSSSNTIVAPTPSIPILPSPTSTVPTFPSPTPAAVSADSKENYRNSEVKKSVNVLYKLDDAKESGILSVSESLKPRYIGCFRTNARFWILQISLSLSGNNSVQRCSDLCSKNGYKVSGVQGDSCWCGNSIDESAIRVRCDDCYLPCSGSDEANCGGIDRIAIFAKDSVVLGDIYAYKGCYKDNGRNSLEYRKTTFYGNNPSLCHRLCLDHGKFQVSAVEGMVCWCGTTEAFSNLEMTDEFDCDLKCPDMSEEWCGGICRKNVLVKEKALTRKPFSIADLTLTSTAYTWSPEIHACIKDNNLAAFDSATAEECKWRCDTTAGCLSVDYCTSEKRCWLNLKNKTTAGPTWYTEPCYDKPEATLYFEKQLPSFEA